jgi:hypothetical protein
MKSINPTVWGTAGWHILHRMSFEFVNVKDAHSFITSLKYILPCQKCRTNLKMHIDKLPIPHDVKDIPLWMWQLHNRVTQSIGSGKQNDSMTKKNFKTPTFKRVEKMYKLHTKQISETVSDESIFLLAIAETHPGARSISEEYLDAIFTFITQYVYFLSDESDKILIDKEKMRSRVLFRELIKNIIKTYSKTETETETPVVFSECT